MKLLQLFCDMPTEELMVQLLNCYGVQSLSDQHDFTKTDLVEIKTVDKLNDMIPELIMYYLPCKGKIYLNDINEKRSITILSQFLKLFDYRLLREEKIINKKKIIYYRIQKLEDSKLHIFRNINNYEIDFR